MTISYTKTNWKNNVTPLSAANMNHIEDGIKTVTDAVNSIDIPSSNGVDSIISMNVWGSSPEIRYEEEGAGLEISGGGDIRYKDSTTGKTVTKAIDGYGEIPIYAGEYIKFNNTTTFDKLTIDVNKDKIVFDCVEYPKESDYPCIPIADTGTYSWNQVDTEPVGGSVVQRDENGSAKFTEVGATKLSDKSYDVTVKQLYFSAVNDELKVNKTSTDTGTLADNDYNQLINYPATKIRYDDKLYYRMDPTDVSTGILNYFHIDSAEDDNSAAGKYFSITVSTKEWKIIDLNFGKNKVQHEIQLISSENGDVLTFSFTDYTETAYTTATEIFAAFRSAYGTQRVIGYRSNPITGYNDGFTVGAIGFISDTTTAITFDNLALSQSYDVSKISNVADNIH